MLDSFPPGCPPLQKKLCTALYTGPTATPTGPGPGTGATHSTTTLSTGIAAGFTVVGAVILLTITVTTISDHHTICEKEEL